MVLRIPESLGQTEIDQIYLVSFLLDTHQEIFGLYITVNKTLRMYVLNPRQHLLSKHQNCLQGEFSRAMVQQILQRRSQKVDYHNKKISLDPAPINFGQSNCSHTTLKNFQYFRFMEK